MPIVLKYKSMIDIDNFKMVNDDFGHVKGDRLLIDLTSLIIPFASRASDCFCRIGGDDLHELADQALYDAKNAGKGVYFGRGGQQTIPRPNDSTLINLDDYRRN